MAGLVAGILSTIDSMMNSTATLFTFDIYKKYIRPDASEMRLIWVGRVAMMLMVGAAIGCRSTSARPRGASSTRMADYNAYLVPGVIVAYVAGILQPLRDAAPRRSPASWPGRSCRSCSNGVAKFGFDHICRPFTAPDWRRWAACWW